MTKLPGEMIPAVSPAEQQLSFTAELWNKTQRTCPSHLSHPDMLRLLHLSQSERVAERRDVSEQLFGELRAVTSAFAVTDEVGKSDGQLQSLLSPRACLASPSCAMFSEGSRHSAVTQSDRQMVHIDSEHERDWPSSRESRGGPWVKAEAA